MVAVDAAVEAGLRFLDSSRNSDGGWGYAPGGASLVEPTAAALMACALHGAGDTGRAFSWLVSAQMSDGGWGISPAVSAGSWMSAWAVWSLSVAGGAAESVQRGVRWLAAVPVLRLTDDASAEAMRRLLDLDAAVTGWPWQPGEASWVTPTAVSVLAMCAAGEGAQPRVAEAVAFLRDRACASGGWNFGNPVMIGKALPPTRPETGLALLALRAAGAASTDAVVSGALAFLESDISGPAGGLDAAWTAAGLAAWGVRTQWEQRVRSDLLEGSYTGAVSVLTVSIALLSLADPARLVGR